MTREEAKELLPVIAAFAEGKAVQVKVLAKNAWVDCSEPTFTSACLYRVKPEPREFWIVDTENAGYHAFSVQTNAIRFVSRADQKAEIIRVREVL